MQTNQQTLELLFSKARLSGYESLEQHESNLYIISTITHKIGILEIVLRNKIDSILSQNDKLWLENLANDSKVEIKYGDLQNDSKDSLISKQSLGFWLDVVDFYRIHNQLLPKEFLDSLNFKRYFSGNRAKFGDKTGLRDYQKVKILLLLLKNLRNRAFHFENLYKLNAQNKPRLNATIYKNKDCVVIGLQSDKIHIFLNDLICCFDKGLLSYASKKK